MSDERAPSSESVDALEAEIRRHNDLYWRHDSPEISDYAFDGLVRRLKELRPDSPVLEELGAGGRDALSSGELSATIVHASPMLSLDKCYEESEILHWARSFEGLVVESPKVDGVAASLRYGPDGRLAVAATRGDGTEGEDFTANALAIPEIPNSVDLDAVPGLPPDGIEVRGEVYMALSAFQRHSEDAANPRNLAAGTLKRKRASRAALHDLSFFAYNLVGSDHETEWDKIEALRALGFRPVESRRVEKTALQAGYERWLERRAHVDFELDGVVFKVDRVSEQRHMGATAHHPRYAIAYKFQGESGESTLDAVEWSVARTGAITPVGIISPIILSGATVTRCSLHNLSVLHKHHLHVGDRVIAMRRGGVIPNIERSLGGGSEEIRIPSVCPSCGAPTRIEYDKPKLGRGQADLFAAGEASVDASDAQALFCSAPERCPAVQVATLDHYVKAVGIDGFGHKLLEQLYDAKLVRDPADLYTLSARDIVKMERVGDILALKLVNSVAQARELPLRVFLQALGVADLGKQASALLEEHLLSLAALRAVSEERLIEIKGIGEQTAHKIVLGLQQRATLIDRLLEHVTVLDAPVRESSDGPQDDTHPLAGRSIVFTGKLATFDRRAAKLRAKAAGATTPSGVSKSLDILVVGDEGSPLVGEGAASSKQRKAEQYNANGASIEIITEREFLRRLEG